jgi:TolB-like protein/tRNA A-37 threonylcarbamoyl transferase component Bud32
VSRSEGAALLPLAESIADGSVVDWDAAEARATTDEQAIIRQLRVLSNLAGLHRSLPREGGVRRSVLQSASPAIGSWAHLTLLARLGGGTFGEVYRAWDRHLEREVALKLLKSDESDDDLDASRIAAEGRRLARVRHPNVITVHGVDVHDGRVGLWMELVRGATLEQGLHEHGPLSAREAALVGIDLCRALAAIHGAGLIHRDVKAQNVMREDGGRIVLMDLGTGRETDRTGRRGVADLAGTPLYLAPEIFDGASAGEVTDLYSLGVLLYHLVTGSFPVPATSIGELQQGHEKRSSIRLRDARADLPTAFVRVIDKAIAADPSQRFATAGALETALGETLAHEPANVGPSTAVLGKPRLRRALFRVLSLLGAVAVAAIAVTGWRALRTRREPGPRPMSIHSIAVLPLMNLSGDPAQEYFADGMTDELIGRLGHLPGIDVISRTSAMQFKGSKKPLPEIARILNVDGVLEGSILVMAEPERATGQARKIRINARLIHAGTDTQLWDRTFEAVVSDALALQSEVVDAVTAGIHLRLSARAAPKIAQDFEAFDLYLKGRYYWNLRTKEGLTQSVRFFQDAIARDPGYAAAYSGLADSYMMLSTYGWTPYAEGTARAGRAASRALELDDRLAEAHASLGLIEDDRLEWAAADASFKRALDLNPGYANAHHWYASHLAQRGDFATAIGEIQKASILDPLSANVQGELGIILFLSRRYDEAILQSEKTLSMNSELPRVHIAQAEAYAQKHMFDRAFASLDRAAAFDPQGFELRTYRARILGLARRRREALDMAGSLSRRYYAAHDGHPSTLPPSTQTAGSQIARSSGWSVRDRPAIHGCPMSAWIRGSTASETIGGSLNSWRIWV